MLFSVETQLTRTTRMAGVRDSLIQRILNRGGCPRNHYHHYLLSSSRSNSQTTTSKTRNHSRTFKMSKPSPYLNNSADPIERTSSPYPDPRELGPKSKILATRTGNYHSTSLRNMVTINTVNKTALHPGGVQYVESSLHVPSLSLLLLAFYSRTKN